jgi:hypothetical protein
MDWVIDPEAFVRAATEFLGPERVTPDVLKNLQACAEEEAWILVEIYRDSGHGFGSSDFSHSLKAVLDSAGHKTEWVNNRLALV